MSIENQYNSTINGETIETDEWLEQMHRQFQWIMTHILLHCNECNVISLIVIGLILIQT